MPIQFGFENTAFVDRSRSNQVALLPVREVIFSNAVVMTCITFNVKLSSCRIQFLPVVKRHTGYPIQDCKVIELHISQGESSFLYEGGTHEVFKFYCFTCWFARNHNFDS